MNNFPMMAYVILSSTRIVERAMMYWRQIGQPVKDVLWVLRINGILARHRTSTYLFPVHVERLEKKTLANSVDPDETPHDGIIMRLQPKRHKHNPRLRHGQIISPRRLNRVFTGRIAVALGIDPRYDAESVLTTRTFADASFHIAASTKKDLANIVDPDEKLHDAASHLGLRCLLKDNSSSIGHVFTKPINPFMPQASRKKALANSVDPDETLHDAASHQGLRYLLIGISEVYEEEDNALFMSKDPTDRPILAGYLINSPVREPNFEGLCKQLDPDETPQNVASHQDPNCLLL
ncbi:hypothetical protein DPMN_037261 [Dreissena polymorpha]|uniref:Uncharacterized protein n=1 Tax=Dreissena polymorpha TaxID=45954 RepID=A0A9D4RPM9_DREPO|nr:hypothetical protein DPMN_037261 [Dreissena polymorpha]